MNRADLKKVFFTLIPLALGIMLIFYQFSSFTDEQINNIKFYFKNANYTYVFASVFFSLLGYWSRAYRWKYALNHLGYRPKFHNSFFAVSISYLMNLTIPRSGEVTRAVILKKYENIPFDKGFGTIVAERIIDLFIFLLFVLVAFIAQFKQLNQFIFSHIAPQKIIIGSIILFALFLTFVLLWKYSKWEFFNRLKNKLSGLIEGLSSIIKMKKKKKYLLHSFFIWFCYLIMFYLCIFAIPETSNISFISVIMGFIFGSLAVGFTNGGIGAFPLSIAKVLLLYGIAEDAGSALGWIIWTSQTLLTIILGLLSYILLSFFNRN